MNRNKIQTNLSLNARTTRRLHCRVTVIKINTWIIVEIHWITGIYRQHTVHNASRSRYLSSNSTLSRSLGEFSLHSRNCCRDIGKIHISRLVGAIPIIQSAFSADNPVHHYPSNSAQHWNYLSAGNRGIFRPELTFWGLNCRKMSAGQCFGKHRISTTNRPICILALFGVESLPEELPRRYSTTPPHPGLAQDKNSCIHCCPVVEITVYPESSSQFRFHSHSALSVCLSLEYYSCIHSCQQIIIPISWA